jgi:glycosyltransferase involved in cell wall biosynthesis
MADDSKMTGGMVRERIRVLWLIKGLGLGGAERLLVSMAHARDRLSFEYEAAYLLPWKDALVEELEKEDVSVACLDGGKEWDLGWALRLRRRLVERPVDVLHVHSAYVASVSRLVAHTVPAQYRPCLVSTQHIGWRGLTRLTRIANSATFALDDGHVAVSDDVRSSVARRHVARVETVVHGVPVEAIRNERAHREEVRAELGALPGETLVGTVANFRAQKAYPDLLDSASRVLRTGAAARFVAVGQGALEEDIRALHGRLGLGDQFMLLGARHDAIRVMAACDLFVLASHYEGYPVALMEALALGLPIVATRVGGVPQAVRHDVEGLLVPPRRPDLLAEAVLALISDPDRRARMALASEQRAGDYDIGRATRRLEDLYRSLVAVSARSPSV